MGSHFVQLGLVAVMILLGSLQSEARLECKQAYQRAAKSCGVRVRQFDANSFYQGVSANDVRSAELTRNEIERIYGACQIDAYSCTDVCKNDPASRNTPSYNECTKTRFQSQLFAKLHRLNEEADRAALLVQGASSRYKAQSNGDFTPAPRMDRVAFRRGRFAFGSYTVYQRDPRATRSSRGGEYTAQSYTGMVVPIDFNRRIRFPNFRNWFHFRQQRAVD